MAGQGLQFLPLARIPAKWDPVWFVGFCKEVLALADTRNAIEGAGITISGQPGEPATISSSEDIQNLLLQSFVLATPSGFLEFERVLAGEDDVVDIVDGGANGEIVVSIAENGITLGKLRQLSGLGVLGNPVDDISNVQNIQAAADKAVLHRTGTALAFDVIDATFISDFQAAVRAAVQPRVAGAHWTRSSALDSSLVQTVMVRVPYTGTIVRALIGTIGGTGSCVVDVWKVANASFPPTVANTITAAAKPTISSGTNYEDTTLTGWTTAVTAGDWFAFKLESSSVFTDIVVELFIQET